MDILIRAAQLILALSILVVVHEFGHYIPAKLFKTRIEKFYLFFDPWFSIFKKKIGDTEWGIGWLPLGGYVKISGMVDESMDKEQLAKPAQPWEFRSKKPWQRLIIMVGGVFVNLVVGFLIYTLVVFSYGKVEFKPTDLKENLSVHPYFEKFGLKSGDNVIAIEGEPVVHHLDSKYPVLDINNDIFLRGARKITVKREDGTTKTFTLPEDVDRQIFQNSTFPVFKPRNQIAAIRGIFAVGENKKYNVRLSDEIVKVNNIKFEDYKGDEIKSITVLRDSNEVKLAKLPKDSIANWFPALAGGIHVKDEVVEIEGKPITYADELTSALFHRKGHTLKLTLKRNGEKVQTEVKVNELAMLGIQYVDATKENSLFKPKYFGFGKCISLGFAEGTHTLGDYASQLKFLFTKKGASSIGGFASIGKMFPTHWDWRIFWLNTAFISLVLAFMNILPIPALDGGHVVFLIYEIVTGKEAPQKVLEYAQIVGFVILMGLLLYANGNDLVKYISSIWH